MSRALLALVFIFCLPVLSLGQERHVMKKFDNGEPYIVWYVVEKGKKKVKVKEEIYYPNGRLDYVGNFKGGVEHGQWTYYYKNGRKKAVEMWNNGKETGIHFEYNEDGTLKLESHYKNGKLIKELKH